MMYIKTGQAPDTAKFEKRLLNPAEQLIAGKVRDSLVKEAVSYLEAGAVVLGGRIVEVVFKVKNTTIGGVAVDIAWSLLSKQLAKVQLQDLTARYEIDERRRLYLASKGLSSYKQIAAL